jgi:hypothetical protein
LERVAESSLEADLVFLNADCSGENLGGNLSVALDLFPQAVIVGSGLDRPSVRDAVEAVTSERGVSFEARGVGWRVLRSGQAAGEQRPGVSIIVTPPDFPEL